MSHFVVVGLGYGDEGKGTIVDYLCETNDIGTVVRFSGGPQAAHNVIRPDGTHHTFSQFGAGTFAGAKTYLSQYMLVNLFNLHREAAALREKVDFDPLDRLTVDLQCVLVTPYHAAANKFIERARKAAGQPHGSCGQGIGETRRLDLEHDLRIRMEDVWFGEYDTVVLKLGAIRSFYVDELGPDFLDNTVPPLDELASQLIAAAEKLATGTPDELQTILDNENCVFEGSQGILLDEVYGFYPYTTWTTTTSEKAREILGDRDYEVIGVTRSYMTRHGAGPFVSETPRDEERWPELHNATGELQGAWRNGDLDLIALKYACKVDGHIDSIAVTHLDVLPVGITTRYSDVNWGDPWELNEIPYIKNPSIEDMQEVTWSLQDAFPSGGIGSNGMRRTVLEEVSRALHLPVSIESSGPTHEDKVTCDLHVYI